MADNRPFLGTGWSFPPSFNRNTRTVDMVSAEEDINQSLDILLATSLGERVMQPRYGANMSDYQFESLNASMISYLKDLVERAILFFEARILLEKIEVTPAGSFDLIEGRLTISIDYAIQGTNTRFNYVYDFYLREANQPPA